MTVNVPFSPTLVVQMWCSGQSTATRTGAATSLNGIVRGMPNAGACTVGV